MIEIPLDITEENYTLEVTLDGEIYTLRFLWNARASSWFFDLTRTSDQLDLLSQQRVTVSTAPLNQFVGFQGETSNSFPAGQFVFVDTAGTDTDPAVDELGARVKMFYLDSTEAVARG